VGCQDGVRHIGPARRIGRLILEHIQRRVNNTDTQTLADVYPSLGKGVLLKETLGKLPEPFKTYWTKASPETFSLG
jgi:hypothetical protein